MDRGLKSYLEDKRAIINKALDRYLYRSKKYPPVIHEAMRFSVFSEGKRLRPVLVLAAGENAAGGRISAGRYENLLRAAAAMEMIHTSSLIHDDLPVMDNDDYRRGRLSCHRKYNEAIAVIAGDALIVRAFEIAAGTDDCRVVREIADASGTRGMIGGQAVDIEPFSRKSKRKEIIKRLNYVHSCKTAALIRVSLRIGALIAGAKDSEIKAIDRYGGKIGMAFQITDDILDIGDDRGISYPGVYGLEASRKKIKQLVSEALKFLEMFGKKADMLRKLAKHIETRKK